MTVKELVNQTGWAVLSAGDLEAQTENVYVCDLLSWAMAHVGKNHLWITVHTHLNVVAVAVMTGLAAVLVPEGIPVDEATLHKAREENITILSANITAYEACVSVSRLLNAGETA